MKGPSLMPGGSRQSWEIIAPIFRKIAAQVDGRSVAGVVVSPLHLDVFAATLSGGATRNGQPIRCASPASVSRCIVGTGFGYDPDRRRRLMGVVW